MRKELQQRYDDGRTDTIERYYKGREKDCSPISEDSRLTGENLTKEEFQEELLPQWQSALNGVKERRSQAPTLLFI